MCLPTWVIVVVAIVAAANVAVVGALVVFLYQIINDARRIAP